MTRNTSELQVDKNRDKELIKMKEDMEQNEEVFNLLEKKYKEQHQNVMVIYQTHTEIIVVETERQAERMRTGNGRSENAQCRPGKRHNEGMQI